MIIYLIVFTHAILFSVLAQVGKKALSILFMFFSSAPLVILASFRDMTIGSDTALYPVQALYNGEDYTFSLFSSIEPLYSYLGYIVCLIKGNIYTMLLITHMFIIFFFYYGIWRLRKYVPMWISVFFFCFLFFNMSLQLSRQSIAISLIFLGFTYLQEKKLYIFIITVIVGFLFHKSAIAAVLIIPYIYSSNKKLQLLVLFCVLFVLLSYSIVLNMFTIIQIFEKYQSYAEGEEFEGRMSNSEIILRISFLIFILYGIRYKSSFNLLLLFLTEFCLNLLQIYSRYVGRIGLYIYVLYFFYLPYLMTCSHNKYKRIKGLPIMRTLIMGLTILYWWFVYINNNAGETYPYTSKILGI